ncbi:hypothetical protein K7432_012117 [Basidiobolus ranarum]|uniref:WD40 repeat-like protein n=1 Tax=Basidiobolus ranarum TaxID=34480 RepID=A0ABR2WL96_9FUNG
MPKISKASGNVSSPVSVGINGKAPDNNSEVAKPSISSPKLPKTHKATTSPKPANPTPVAPSPQAKVPEQSKSAQSSPQIPTDDSSKPPEIQAISMPSTPATDGAPNSLANPVSSTSDSNSSSQSANPISSPSPKISSNQNTNPVSSTNMKTSSSQPANPLDIDQFIMDEDFSSFFGNVDSDNLGIGEDMDVDSFGNMDFFSNMGFMGGSDNPVESQSNGQVLQLHAQLAGHTNKVSTCAISSKGDWLASAGHDKKVLIWSIFNKSLAHTLDGHTQQITNARFSPDDRQLLATASYDKTVRIWNIGSSNKVECATTFTGHTRSVTAIDFCPVAGSNSCCSVDAEGELKVWNIFTGICEKTIRLSSTSKYSGYSSNPVRYNPQAGSKVATAISNTLIYIDVFACEDNSSASDHLSTRTFATQHSKNIFTVDWSLDGSFLLTASEDLICVWDATTFKVIYTQQPQTGKISSCCFLANNNPTSNSKTLRVAIGEYEVIYIWAFAGGDGEAKLKAMPGAQNGVVSCLASGYISDTSTNNKSPILLLTSASGSKDENLKTWIVST